VSECFFSHNKKSIENFPWNNLLEETSAITAAPHIEMENICTPQTGYFFFFFILLVSFERKKNDKKW